MARTPIGPPKLAISIVERADVSGMEASVGLSAEVARPLEVEVRKHWEFFDFWEGPRSISSNRLGWDQDAH
jgi:hypothetical protein